MTTFELYACVRTPRMHVQYTTYLHAAPGLGQLPFVLRVLASAPITDC